MTLLILSLFAIAEETKTYEIEFEPVIIIARPIPAPERKKISLKQSFLINFFLLRKDFNDRALSVDQ